MALRFSGEQRWELKLLAGGLAEVLVECVIEALCDFPPTAII